MAPNKTIAISNLDTNGLLFYGSGNDNQISEEAP